MTPTTAASIDAPPPAAATNDSLATPAGARAARAPTEPRYLELWGIRWETYEALVEDVAEQHVGITYDAGRMVIMPPLQVHDLRKKIIARMVELSSIVMQVPIASYGSSTWRRRDLQKGIEADECYYVQNEPLVRGKELFELAHDPAPDLAIEIENTHHPLDRPSIYAALGVNEIWTHDGRRLRFLKRGEDGHYQPISASNAFPFLTPEVLEEHLEMVRTRGEYATMSAFHDWLASLPRHRG